MKANSLSLLTGVCLRLKLVISRLLSVLTGGVGLVRKQLRNYVDVVVATKRRGKDGGAPRGETRVLPRAERFAIETEIRYRDVGQDRWYEGKTQNISGSGVLFRAKKLLALKTRVEMIFPLPIGGSGASGANVRCFGQTVRKAAPVVPGGDTGLAVTIEEYDLMHAKEVSGA